MSTKPAWGGGGNLQNPGAVATPTSKGKAACFSNLVIIRTIFLHQTREDETDGYLQKICLPPTPSFDSGDSQDVL